MSRTGEGNTSFAVRIAAALARAGVTEVCLCAGARNSPLIELFSASHAFGKFHFFEERSAAFFALGRIKSGGRPVAVVTTSGTAAAELLSAAIEAHYSGLPLVLLTADRPRNYRGTAAPQAIEQKGLFGPYAQLALDLEADEPVDLASWIGRGPLHLNACFDEPLLDRSPEPAELRFAGGLTQLALGDFADSRASVREFLDLFRRPLVLVGELSRDARAAVEAFLVRLGAPVYAEAPSGLRESVALSGQLLRSGERMFGRVGRMREPVDAVLRIGGVPTTRFWRDLETVRTDLPVLSVSELPFSGTPRSRLVQARLSALFGGFDPGSVGGSFDFSDLLEWDRSFESSLLELLRAEPRSEPGMIHALSTLIPTGSGVYLGNSLPIREWDLAAARPASESEREIAVNRGANGIDGQLSTFYGFARPGRENWAILGDLTAMYDLSAPWILSQLGDARTRLVVVNNGGGKIFSRMFQNPVFQNKHEVSFEGWAAMWKLAYRSCDEVAAIPPFTGVPHAVVELRPDARASERFWAGLEGKWIE